MANVQLLQKTLDHIKAHPEEWEQRFWRCETKYCFAGHAAIIGGAEWVVAENDPNPDNMPMWDLVTMPGSDAPREVQFAASELLEITDRQADKLYWGSNTVEDLEYQIEAIIAGRETPDRVPSFPNFCGAPVVLAHP